MKYKFNTKVFILGSLIVFVLISMLISFFFFLISVKYDFNGGEMVHKVYLPSSKKYKNIETKDLFVTKNPNIKQQIKSPILNGNDPSIGNGNIIIVEFFDYDCEFCQKQENSVMELINGKYNNKVKIIFKNFPINNHNSFSWKASVASRCAYNQGGFEDYHNLLYKNTAKFSDDLFLNLASDVNLDIAKFKKCYKNQDTNHFIEDNIREATDLHVSGIPFYYIGSQEIIGELNIETLDKMIQIELSKNE